MISVGLLDFLSSMMLFHLNLVPRELNPKVIEVLDVFVHNVIIVDDDNVFLIGFTSLECPVERTGQDKELIDDKIFIVHVILLLVVGSYGDTLISGSLGIGTLALHGFVVGNDSDLDTALVGIDDGVSEVVVGEGENSKLDGFSCFFDVTDHLSNVGLIREEKGVSKQGIGSVKVLLNFSSKLSQANKNLFVMITFHTVHCKLKAVIDGGLNVFILSFATHLVDGSSKIFEINLLAG